MKKIVVGINTLTDVNAHSYRNHLILFYNIGRYTDYELLLVAPHRLGIDHMRNTCANLALEKEYDYIFFLDDDVTVPPDTLNRLTKDIEYYNADIICGLTFIRSFPFQPMIYKDIGTKRDIKLENYYNYKENVDELGIVKCAAVGFSCALLRVSTLLKIEPPYFVTGPFNTEDIYYCCKLQQESKDEPFILCDTTIECGHLLEPETVSEYNVEDLRKRYAQFSNWTPSKRDRSESYLKEVEVIEKS